MPMLTSIAVAAGAGAGPLLTHPRAAAAASAAAAAFRIRSLPLCRPCVQTHVRWTASAADAHPRAAVANGSTAAAAATTAAVSAGFTSRANPSSKFEFDFDQRLKRGTNSVGTTAAPSVTISACAKHATINFGSFTSSFDAIWLRDHCRCPDCFHQSTKQRLVDTYSIPAGIRISSATIVDDGNSISFSFDDKHTSVFNLEWLRTHAYRPAESNVFEDRKKSLWGCNLKKNLPCVDYKSVMAGDDGLRDWLNLIDEYGIAFVKNVPANAEATETLGRRISFIRETHYGTFWDFTANNAHADTAYTGLALQAHTDTTYFTDPVGLQLFHITEFTGKGGMSLYVDGFNAANRLHEIAPEHYNLLSTVRVPTHSAGDPSTVIAPTPRAFPILNLDPVSGKLFQVRFNNDDRSVLGGRALLDKNGSTVDVAQFYDALRTWVGILRDPEFELWIQLTPGLVVIVDNWRVLHGRSEFTGHRRVCGSYHGYDDYRSRVRDLCYGKAGRADI